MTSVLAVVNTCVTVREETQERSCEEITFWAATKRTKELGRPLIVEALKVRMLASFQEKIVRGLSLMMLDVTDQCVDYRACV